MLQTILPCAQRTGFYQVIDNLLRSTLHDMHTQPPKNVSLRTLLLPPPCDDTAHIQGFYAMLYGEHDPVESIFLCRHILHHMPSPPSIRHTKPSPRHFGIYSFQKDQIRIRASDHFSTLAQYFFVLFHELIHSTGHPNRLNRPVYTSSTEEEVIAELGAMYLAGIAGTLPSVLLNGLSYVITHLNKCRADETKFLNLAAKARVAAEYILNSPSDETNKPSIPRTRPLTGKPIQGTLF